MSCHLSVPYNFFISALPPFHLLPAASSASMIPIKIGKEGLVVESSVSHVSTSSTSINLLPSCCSCLLRLASAGSIS